MDRLTEFEVLDTRGRLIVTPHALTLEGQSNVPAELVPGENLLTFLDRHVPSLHSGAWAVYINDVQVPQSQWRYVRPKHGTVIAVRSVVQRQVVQLVATFALAYFTIQTGGLGASLNSALGLGLTKTGLGLLNAALFTGGSLLINKVLGPRMPGAAGATNNADPVYSLGSARNQVRKYEPIPLVLGINYKYAPDYASVPYTWFEGNDQYLATILNLGINVGEYLPDFFRNGETAMSDYEDVSIYNAGFASMPDDEMPLHSNPDSATGAELETPDGDAHRNPALWNVYGAWVQRTTSTNTVEIQVDLEGQLYASGSYGMGANEVRLQIEYAPLGTENWTSLGIESLKHSKTSPVRRTVSWAVEKGQYNVRVRSSTAEWDGSGDVCVISWTQLKSIQIDEADYSGLARIGLKIKATGQLNGALDELNVIAIGAPMPFWDGTAWVTATRQNNGLINPGAQILKLLRGIYIKDKLVAGLGLPDSMIDVASIMAFMDHCRVNDFSFSAVIKDARGIGELLDSIALAGFGQLARIGGKIGIAWAWADQPISGVVNMATMKAGSFGVNYTLANAADGIEYTYFDEQTWETVTIRVSAPGVTSPINPSRITGEGITNPVQAAKLARWHLAQSLYQYKDISFETDLEHLDYRRLGVLAISHDMTKWGQGGRLVSASTTGSTLTVQVDQPISGNVSHIGLRVPGEATYRVFPCTVSNEGRTVVVAGWPEAVQVPGHGEDNPAHDTLWIADFRATPGYKVRVVSIEPSSDMGGASVAVVPESPEYWDYVINGTYVPVGPHNPDGQPINYPPNPSITSTAPVASGLYVSEAIVSGNLELSVSFAIANAYSRAEIWCGRLGEDVVQVATTETLQAFWRVSGPGVFVIQVRPFGPELAGPPAVVQYETAQPEAPLPPSALRATGVIFGIALDWSFPRTALVSHTEIWYAQSDDQALAVKLGDFAYPTANHLLTGLPAGYGLYFWARCVSTSGIVGDWFPVGSGVYGETSSDATAILDYLTGQITQSQLGQELLSEIEQIGNLELSINDILAGMGELEAEIAALTGAGAYDPEQEYLAGMLVAQDGSLYKAKVNVPIDTPPPNTTYWEYVGEYTSIGDAITALMARINTLENGTARTVEYLLAENRKREDDDWSGVQGHLNEFDSRALIRSERIARVDGDEALAQTIEQWGAWTGDSIAAAIQIERTARTDADEALAYQIINLQVQYEDLGAAIQEEQRVRVNETEALAESIVQMKATIDDDVSAAIREEQQARVAGDQAQAQSTTELQAVVEQNRVNAISQMSALANQQGAQATQIQTLQTQTGNNSAAISATNTAVSGINGKLRTSTVVRHQITANGLIYAAGWALDLDYSGGMVQSQFLVNATTFAVLNATNGTATATAPFIVQNGQVFIRQAFIGDGWIDNAKIGNYIAASALIGGQPRWEINKTGDIIMRSGQLRNGSADTYINLNATGNDTFLRVNGGTVQINANGDSYFDGVILSRPSVVAAGIASFPGIYTLYGIAVPNQTGDGLRFVQNPKTTFVVHTSIANALDWGLGAKAPMLAARARYYSGHFPGMGSAFNVVVSARVVNYGSYSGGVLVNDPNIAIEIELTVPGYIGTAANSQNPTLSIQNGQFQWALFSLT